ncbi:hypothetical protein O181_117369 [Austropuccinia psidii MF-1]|uniref:Uncharacterized protein n=1 Tax=Austropuccinia psidii MF-1 TaxID=1389203 RepID=A0A9Q3PXF2_9BASI|nr:hypothetical protein [Austropuccinia psidii MF-1]
MTTCRYSSMCICMCHNCSTQTHSSAGGDRQGVAFTPLQYKKHIKKLKSKNEPNDHDPPCTQSLGKFIYSFEPCTQITTNMKQKFIPTKHFIYQPFKNFLARFLQRAGIMESLHQNQQSQTPAGSPK